MMMATQNIMSFISFSSISLGLKTNNTPRTSKPTFARKKDTTENVKAKLDPIFLLRVPNVVLARSAIAVLGLGFIDAGYSEDWSRIGVISKETEDLLKLVAYAVVPICLLLIFSFTEEQKDV